MHMTKALAGLVGAVALAALAGMLVMDAAAQRRDRDDVKRQDRDDGQRDRDDARRRDRGWVLLGEKDVGFRVDRDVINIGQSEEWYRDRSFRSLQFVAEGNEVHLISVRLVYFNGFAEDLRVDRLIRRGDELALDLRGERSYLRRIEMTYRSRPGFRGQAVVKVYGEPARRGPPGPVSGDDDARRHDRGWVLLGKKDVGLGVDRDVINIGQSEEWYRDRSFRSLQFVAEGNEVHLISVRLVYFNGFAEDLRVDRLIRRGDELALDLRGERSYLRRIEMTYRSRPGFRGQAVVKVYGEPARRGPPGPVSGGDWQELGCQQVSLLGKDRDSVKVGRREGRFRAIRLVVRGADVEVLDLKVIYAGGDPDDIRVKSLIKAGERTRPLDLRGRERAIERVDMVYRTDLNPMDIIAKQRIRTATVCVEGLQ